jgi:hypothetical protein
MSKIESLISYFTDVIECNGGYNCRIQHMNKARLKRLGLLPQSILVTDAAKDWDGISGSDDDDNEETDDEEMDDDE